MRIVAISSTFASKKTKIALSSIEESRFRDYTLAVKNKVL